MTGEQRRLFYIATTRVPSERAHVVQILATCEGFAGAGAAVTLLVPARREAHTSVFAASAAERDRGFETKYLPALDLSATGAPFANTFLAHSFRASVAGFLNRSWTPGAVVYVRSEIFLPLVGCIDSRIQIFWETHEMPVPDAVYQRVLPRLTGLVVTTALYANDASSRWRLDPGRILVAPNGADVEAFRSAGDRLAARHRLGVPVDKDVLMYVGLLSPWKGAGTLFAVSNELWPEIETVVIGDFGNDRSKAPPSKARLLGRLPYAMLADNLAAADVLALPNSAALSGPHRYTSPLKLFAYLASGIPIVASDLPVFREVVSDDEVFFVRPDDPAAFAETVRYVLANRQEAKARAARARERALGFSWDRRARSILDWVDQLASPRPNGWQ